MVYLSNQKASRLCLLLGRIYFSFVCINDFLPAMATISQIHSLFTCTLRVLQGLCMLVQKFFACFVFVFVLVWNDKFLLACNWFSKTGSWDQKSNINCTLFEIFWLWLHWQKETQKTLFDWSKTFNSSESEFIRITATLWRVWSTPTSIDSKINCDHCAS